MTEVGSVSVRVIPDTSKFRRELEAKLKSINDKIDISFGADTSRIRKEVEAATKELPDGKVKVDVEVNQRLINDALTGLRNKIINVPVDPQVRPGWREEIQAEIDAAKALTVDADLSSKGVRENLAAVLAELQTAAALNPVEIPVELDRKTLRNLLGSAAAGLGDTLSGAMSGLSGLAGGGLSKMAGIAPMLLAIAAAATLVAPALALVSGSMLLIPAAVAGIAAPIGAVILGLDGIKAAAEAAGLTSTTTGPRGAKKTGLGETLAALKTAVSDTFKNGLTPAFTQINDAIPKLTEQFKTLAQGMSGAFSGIIDGLTSDTGMNNIQKTVNNLGVAFDKARPGLKSFTEGILQLMGSVSEKFPNLGDKITELGGKFADWATKFTTKDAVTGVSELDTTLTNLKATWDQISGLGGDLFKQGLAWMSDPNFGKSMEDFFASVRTFVVETLPSLGRGFQDFAGMLKGLEPTFKAIGTTIETMGNLTKIFQGNPEGLKGIWNQLTGKGDAQNDPTAIGSQAGKDVSAAFGEAIKGSAEAQKAALKGAFTPTGVSDAVKGQISAQMNTAITEAKASMTALGPALQTGIDAATAPLQQLPTMIGTTFGTLGAAVGGAWGAVVQNVATGANQIVVAISSAFAQVATIGTSALAPLAGGVATSMASVVQAVVAGGQQIVAELSGWPAQFQAAVGNLGAALVGAGAQLVQGLVIGINSNKGAAIAAAAQMASEVAAASRSKLGIKSPSRVFMEIGDNVGQGFIDGMDAKQAEVTKQATQLAQAASAAAEGSIKMGGISLGINTGGMTDQKNALKVQQETLDVQLAQMRLDKANTTDKGMKAGIQAQIDQLNARKQQLAVQKEQLAAGDQYGKQQSGIASTIDDQFNQMTKMPMDFAMANADQFMSDIGMGGGAITEGLKAGIGMASQYVFNVSGIGEALTAKNNLTNKAAVGIVGR